MERCGEHRGDGIIRNNQQARLYMKSSQTHIRRLSAAIILTAFVCSIGCGPKPLNRADAKQRLDDYYKSQPVDLPAFFSEDGVRMALEDRVLAPRPPDPLLPPGYFKDPIVGPNGQAMIRNVFYPFGQRPLQVNLRVPCHLVVDEITGLRVSEDRRKIYVEYSVHPSYPNEIQKYFIRADQKQNVKTEFVLYDDGWRLSK